MTSLFNRVCIAVLFASFLIAGCSVIATENALNGLKTQSWHGRLAVRVETEPVQGFNAAFELSGSAQTGELVFYTPIGSTAARLVWSPQSAALHAEGRVQYFESLDALIERQLGTRLPALALFAWLAGNHVSVVDWNADLSDYGNGRITARRTQPAPSAEVRLLLEN